MMIGQPAFLYQHTQDTASDTWTIVHNLGMYPCVDVYVTTGGSTAKAIPDEVTYVDASTCVITFADSVTGFATVC